MSSTVKLNLTLPLHRLVTFVWLTSIRELLTALQWAHNELEEDRALDRGRIGIFYTFKMPKTHWRYVGDLKYIFSLYYLSPV
jgi:hypothetical protein